MQWQILDAGPGITIAPVTSSAPREAAEPETRSAAKAEPYQSGFFRTSETGAARVWVDPKGQPWLVRQGTIYSRPKTWEGLTMPRELAEALARAAAPNYGLDVPGTIQDRQAVASLGSETVTVNAPTLGRLAADATAICPPDPLPIPLPRTDGLSMAAVALVLAAVVFALAQLFRAGSR
jgi:hypothetical protein